MGCPVIREFETRWCRRVSGPLHAAPVCFGNGGDSSTRPISRLRRAARPSLSCSLRKNPISCRRPCDSTVSRLGCSGEPPPRILTCAQCRGNSTQRVCGGITSSITTTVSEIVIVCRWCRRAMLVRNAQASRAISSPANGSTSQKPSKEMGRAIDNEVMQTLTRNQRAPRGVSEQCGAISMLVSEVTAHHRRIHRIPTDIRGLQKAKRRLAVHQAVNQGVATLGESGGVAGEAEAGKRRAAQPFCQHA